MRAAGQCWSAFHGWLRPQSNSLISRKSNGLRGEAVAPGDKSVSHRSLILGGMAVGETTIEGLLEGQDVLDTAKAMSALGARVERGDDRVWRVSGVGVGGFAEPADVIDCGNSGTGVRLLMGAVATHDFATTFTGDASLRKRPMGRILTPLAQFGASAIGRSGGRLPLTLKGAANPVPVEYALPVASAQVKSAVLLAGLNAPGATVVIEPEATRDHTERMLRGLRRAGRGRAAQGGRVDHPADRSAGAARLQCGRASRPVLRRVSRGRGSADAGLRSRRVPGIGMNPTRAGPVRHACRRWARI